jgi:8-oxo-dGTP diphosphatase
MKNIIRIVAIAVKDNRLLLVKGSEKYKEYWTPGGKLEEGESELECLKRELKEELNVKLTSAKFFKEYIGKRPYEEDALSTSRVYIAEISGEIKVGNEIKNHVWMSKDEFNNNKYPLVDITKEKIIPDLIEEKIF